MNINIRKIFASASVTLLVGGFLLGGITEVSAQENTQVSENNSQVKIENTANAMLDTNEAEARPLTNKIVDANFLRDNPPTIQVDTLKYHLGETIRWRHIRNGIQINQGSESISKVGLINATGTARIRFPDNYYFADGDAVDMDLINAFGKPVDYYVFRINRYVNPTAPQLNGVENVTVNLGASFDPMHGVTATGVDGSNITSRVIVTGTVNTNIPGFYDLTYSVTDPLTNLTTTMGRRVFVQPGM